MKRMHDDYSNPTIKRKSITDSRIHQSPPEIIPEITPKQISPIQQITSSISITVPKEQPPPPPPKQIISSADLAKKISPTLALLREKRHNMMTNSIKISRNLAKFELRNLRLRNIENRIKVLDQSIN